MPVTDSHLSPQADFGALTRPVVAPPATPTQGVGPVPAGQGPAGHARAGQVPAVDLRITGRLDADSVLRLRESLVPSLADGPVIVLVEISDVTRAVASGIAGLLELRRTICVRGGDLRLYGASPAVGRARAAARLDLITRIFPTRDEALTGSLLAPRTLGSSRRARRLLG